MALPGKKREQDLTAGLTPSVQVPQEEPQIVEEDSSFLETAGDVLIAPFRGIEGMLNGAYNLADMATFDVLPDWDTRFLGTSKTTAGSLVEGISQFASGFVPIFGAAGKIGALAKAGTVTRGIAAGAVTDFAAFKGQEDRLSNLIQQFPELQNPVTEFLAHDANESEVEGRLKNVLEGLILEGAIGGTVALFMKSIRALKAGKKARDIDGKGPDEVNQIVANEAPTAEEFKLSEVTEDESFLARQQGQKEFEEDFREVGGDPDESFEIDLTQDYSAFDLDEPSPAAITLTKEESETIQAGGQLISETNVAGKIIKKYQLPSGSTRTLISDPQNPERLIDAASIIPKERTDVDFAPGDDKAFYVYSDGKQFGPFNRQQVQERLDANVFKPTDKLAQAGDQEWVDVSRVINRTEEAPTTQALTSEGLIQEQKEKWADKIDSALGIGKPIKKVDPDTGEVTEEIAESIEDLPNAEKLFDIGDWHSGPSGLTESPNKALALLMKETGITLNEVHQAAKREDQAFNIRMEGGPNELDENTWSLLWSEEEFVNLIENHGLTFEDFKNKLTPIDIFESEGIKGGIKKKLIAAGYSEKQLKDIANRVDKAFKDMGFDFFEEAFPSPTSVVDLDAKLGKIGPELKKDFYNKTLVEGVSTRMQTGKPMTAREAIQDLFDRTNGNLGEYSPIVKKLLALGKNTGIDAKLEERSFASDVPTGLKRGSFYESGKRRIVLDGQSSSVKNNPIYNLLHEATHAVTVDNVNKYYDSSAFKNIDVNDVAARAKAIDKILSKKSLPKPIAEMFRMFKKADAMRDEIASKGKLVGKDGKPDLYWIKNPAEFMSMAFSDPQLQQALKGIQYTPKMTMWEKVVNTVKSFFGRGVSTDLADNIVSRVGEIAEMKLPSQRGRKGLEMMPGDEVSFQVDFAPEGRGVPGKSKIETDPEWQQWTDATLKGESPTLPRLEVVGDIDSAHKILTKKYADNPELLKKFDEAPVNFLDDEDLTSLFEMGAKSIKDRRRIRVESEIFKDLLKGSNERLMKAVKEFDDTESLQSEAALRNQLSEFVEIYDYYRQMGSEDSKNLAMRRQKKPISRKIGLERSELQNTALVREFINNQAGGMSPKKAVKLIKEMYDPNNPEATIKKVLGIAKKAQGKSLLDMTTEYWINSILSGPRTQAVNLLGNTLTQVLGTAEMVAGAVLSGNMPLAKAALASWADSALWREALSATGKTLVTGREVLDVGSRTMESSSQAIGDVLNLRGGLDQSKSIKQTSVDILGNVVNLPARGLLTGDELFKQLAFRRAARLKAGMEAINSGISDSKGIAKYVEDKLNKVVTVSGQVMSEEALIREATKQADKLGLVGQKFAKKRAAHIKKYVDDNFDEDASTLAAYALEEAKYFTHTRELEEGTLGKSIQNLTKNFAFARFVLPFVRTPSNLLSFALERSPLSASFRIPGTNKRLNVPGLRSEAEAMREGLKSSDPVIQAAARGKIVTAFAGVGLFYEMVFNNNNTLPLITGGGPKDERQKKILAETGWRPYSIKIGDTYYEYKKLDPIATILGIVADMSEMMKENEEANEEGVEQVGIALATALSRNVANKSYLAGIQLWAEALQDPDRFGERLGRNYVSSFVPNVLSQMQDYDKQSMREVRDVADAILKKLPGGRDMLDPKRNILGEEKTIDYGTMGFINPVGTSREKDDAILQEMADLQYAFRQPSPKLSGGNVNLLDFVNNRGRTAYDRSLDLLQTVTIGGRTLRQTLKRLIKSSQYQRLPGFSAEVGVDSPRVQEITKVLRRYRKIAKREMLKEFPDVATQINNVDRALKLNRQGVNRQDVLELLQQTN